MFKPRVLWTVLMFAGSSMVMGQETEPKKEDRTAAVKAMLSSYAQAFNAKDLDKVASAWATDCSYFDKTTRERVEGKTAMRADLKKSFTEQPGLRLSATVDRVKFITDNVAKVEGQTVMTSPGEDPQQAEFSAILVDPGNRQHGWQIHSLEESAVPQPETAYDALKQLEWLIGRWTEETENARVESAFRWSPGKAFLVRSYSIQTETGIAQQGTQVIGWDPRAKHVRSWTFNSDGAFGEGIWSKNGKDWLIKSAQTLADGRAASGTYVLTEVNNDKLQLQLIGHSIGGVPQPTSEAVTMLRTAAEEGGNITPFGPNAPQSVKPKKTP